MDYHTNGPFDLHNIKSFGQQKDLRNKTNFANSSERYIKEQTDPTFLQLRR